MLKMLKFFSLYLLPVIAGASFQMTKNEIGKMLIVTVGMLLFFRLLERFTGGIE